MLQNRDVFFKWFYSLTEKISLPRSEQAELESLRLSSDISAYQRRREIFSKYMGMLLRAIILDLIGCSIPSLASKIGCSKQRLYRITNGQIIQGFYEIFCILYILGCPFPMVFSSFVSDRILQLRKIVECRRDVKDHPAECEVSTPKMNDLSGTVPSNGSPQTSSCEDPSPIPHMNSEKGNDPRFSENGHTFAESLLSVFRSNDGELLL